MIVLDNSALVDVLTVDEIPPELDESVFGHELHVPHLLDFEFRNALRGMVLGGKLRPNRADGARFIKETLPFVRYPDAVIGHRAWDLRGNFNAYDASYIALAEYLGLPLVTTDAKIERQARTIEVRLIQVKK